MSLEYWYMFPISVVIAILANAAGFSGGIIFQPIYNIFMNIPIANSVATGIATETVGMTSGALRYFWQKQLELSVGLTMVMLTIPGIVIGNHVLMIVNGNILKIVLGVAIFILATMQLITAVQNKFGTKTNVPIEDIYGFMWVPPLGGFFSATTGTGMCELSQPVLERGMNVQTKRANATAVLIEATGDWIITILNLHAGFIMWELWIFTGSGVIVGGQIGPYLAKYLPDKIIKIVFSVFVLMVALFYMYQGIVWLLK